MDWLSPETLQRLEAYSSIFRSIALLGGLFIVWQWIVSRRDRSTEVLFELEKQFERKEMIRARKLVEDDAKYQEIRLWLLRSVLPVEGRSAAASPTESESMQDLDTLLRFYVLLTGVRRSKQIKDSVLRACFRYWLAHYFHPGRRELRLYIDSFFPTLRQWLRKESRFRRGFFRPAEFGWGRARRVVRKHQIQQALRGRVLVLSGAGLSADSGLKTFWGEEGHYRNRRPEDLATRAAFDRDPEGVWAWYRERQANLRDSVPNAGHSAIARLAEGAEQCLVATQNVDDLHERAGTDPAKIVHVHGELLFTRCRSCEYRVRDTDHSLRPECPRCGDLMRPDVVWFDEDLDSDDVGRVEDFITAGAANAVLLVGTSARFDYIVDWAIRAAGETGLIVEINPIRTCITPAVDFALRSRGARALPPLVSRLPSARAASLQQESVREAVVHRGSRSGVLTEPPPARR